MKTSIISLLLAAVLPLSAAVLKNDDFSKGLRGWNTPAYWAGKTTQFEENGRKYLLLESGARSKTEIFGRALGYGRQVPYFPGDTVVIKIKAKGNGKLNSGVLVYRFGSGAPQYAPGGEYPLTSEFKTYEFKSGLKEQFRMILPYMEIKGAGKAVVESFRMETVADPSVSVKAETSLQVASEKHPGKPFVFKTSVKNGEIAVSCKSGEKSSSKMVKTSADGSLAVPTDKLPPGFHQISVSKAGNAATATIDVQPENVFRTTDEIAKKIKLNKPVRVLFLGDSLSDFYRGYNYIDRIDFWIGKYNPGKFSFRNAGVGGDFCKRMLDRLHGEASGKRLAYRQEMYNGLFREKYDLVFLFLGQNDTRCFRKDGFARQETPPALQRKCLAEIRKMLKEKCPGAELVLISPSPSDEDLFIQRDKKLRKGVNMVMYGKKELVDLYDAENRKFCKENGLRYIDILSVMRSVSPIKSLYVTDGIHLSPEGGRVIADEILKFFAEKYQ